MVMQMRGEQNTHVKVERVKIPLFPNNVDKYNVTYAGPKQGHDK